MFRVGDFSRLSNISIRMLRHYDKMGLLVPDSVDKFTGYRYYSASQLGRANKIQQLKSLGFSLAVIGEMLDGNERDVEQFYAIRQMELKEESARIKAQTDLLEQAINILKEGEHTMKYNVVIKEIPARDVMSLRKVIPSYSDEGMLWQELFEAYTKMGVKSANPPMGVTVFHDREFKEHDVDVEIQSSIEGSYEDTGDIKFYTAPAVRVASVTFHGSYDQMGAVNEAVAQYLEANNLAMDGTMFNIMHVSPGQDPNPENWITEACYPIK